MSETVAQERARFLAKIIADNNRTLLLNSRAVASRKYARLPNWKVAADLFGLGSTFASMLCREYGFDPNGYRFTQPPPKISKRRRANPAGIPVQEG